MAIGSFPLREKWQVEPNHQEGGYAGQRDYPRGYFAWTCGKKNTVNRDFRKGIQHPYLEIERGATFSFRCQSSISQAGFGGKDMIVPFVPLERI